jgi:biotin operon repressor
MESGIILVQKLKKKENDVFSLAERYYKILSAINDLFLTEREIQLIAYTAVKGNISYANIREEFCKKHNTSSATINNIISKLKKVGVLIKDGTKVKVNPVIILDFNKNISLEIKLTHG